MKEMKVDPQWMEVSFAERSSAIGREWREMSPEEQAPWKQKASEARAEFKQEKRKSRFHMAHQTLAAGGAQQDSRLPVISSVQSCAPVMQILQTEGQSQPQVHPRIGPTQIDGRRTINRTPFQLFMEDRLVQIKSAMGTQSWNETCRTHRTFYSDTQVKIHNQWDAMSAEDRKKYQDMASQAALTGEAGAAVEQVIIHQSGTKVHLLDPVSC